MSSIYNGYYKTEYDYGIPEYLAEKLNEILPHGSGINFDWTLEYDAISSVINAYNAFDAMNENGYYCHVWPFIVKIPVISKLVDEEDYEYSSVSIDWDNINEFYTYFVGCDPEKDCPEKWVVDEYFSQFEKDEFGDYSDEVLDNEPVGCGYMLGDYLNDLIYCCFYEAKP